MSLSKQLQETKERFVSKAPEAAITTMAEATEALKASGIDQKATKKGDKAPNFQLPNHLGQTVSSQTLLNDGPLVVTFYRGSWCPYCNLELNAYKNQIAEIEGLGAKLVAITPMTPDQPLSHAEKEELPFQVLSDVGLEVSRQFGLVFQLPDNLKSLYQNFGIELNKANGNDSWELPIAATYILGADGTVEYSFVDVDYTKRADPSEVIEKLKEITANH